MVGTLNYEARWRVHPRVCGEHRNLTRSNSTGAGSSPRVRGTYPIHNHVHPIPRFIPACAGNIDDTDPPPDHPSVHPRVCGEHMRMVFAINSVPGSSPRVRGTFSDFSIPTATDRFIPACAGNIYAQQSMLLSVAVHPRVCGEHGLSPFLSFAIIGSSPRVRGTCRPPIRYARPRRFIPACAGNIL